jgi:hypothetical protein
LSIPDFGPRLGLSQVFGTSPALVKRMRQTRLRVTSAGDVLAKNPVSTPALGDDDRPHRCVVEFALCQIVGSNPTRA